ncbi:MAG: TetR/AcrR family transcriptional regulator [Thermodesulfobacteriota bacterium]|nr:TetR/AcrR family transcriptional regulator [Thermodesulfobacteriota bacterium]
MPKRIVRKSQIKKNRATILQAAKKLFFSKDFTNITMEDIAGYSGLERRTLYNHFKNKGDILTALVSEVITKIEEICNEIDLRSIPSIEQLETLTSRLLDVYVENFELLNIFTPQYKSDTNKKQIKAMSAFMVENITAYKKIEARLVQIIKHAQDEGVVIDTHPYILAGLFNEAILRSAFVWHNYKKDLTEDDIIKDIIRVIRKGSINEPQS